MSTPRGTAHRGRCPSCGRTRNLRLNDPVTGDALDGAVLTEHRDPREPIRSCPGVGRPPTTVASP